MSQNDTAPATTQGLTSNWNRTAAFLDALKTNYSGTSLPTVGVSIGQTAHRTSDNTTWICVATGPTVWRPMRLVRDLVYRGTISGDTDIYLPPADYAQQLVAVTLASDTATTSSSAGVKGYTFQVYNVTQAVNLFGTAPGTKDGEIAIGTRFTIQPDQNQSTEVGDVCQLQIRRDVSSDSLTTVSIWALWIMED